MNDHRYCFTLHDVNAPPTRQVVRVSSGVRWDSERQRACPVRTYLRTENDDWIREDTVELEPQSTAVGIAAGVRRSWAELLELEGRLVAAPFRVDSDFDGFDAEWRRWLLLEAGGSLGAVLCDITFHRCVDGSWADHSLSGPAAELAEIDATLAELTEVITKINDRLRMLKMHTGRRANERWRDDLAALDARIRGAQS